VAVARSCSDGSTIRYVLPVLWMTSCFHIIERMGRIRDDDAYVSSSLPDGGISRMSGDVTALFGRVRKTAASGAKFTVSDCIQFKLQ